MSLRDRLLIFKQSHPARESVSKVTPHLGHASWREGETKLGSDDPEAHIDREDNVFRVSIIPHALAHI